MVITPKIRTLDFTFKDNYKCFNLIAEEVTGEILPKQIITCAGYNASLVGPTIIVNPNDSISINLINKLPYKTSLNFSGLDVPSYFNKITVNSGASYEYRFNIKNYPGTFMYHPNPLDNKVYNSGLIGGFIISDPMEDAINNLKDYLIILQDWHIDTKSSNGNDLNFFTFNGKCYPKTESLKVSHGNKVRIRFINNEGSNYPIHIEGHQFKIVGTDGFPIKREAQLYKNTLLISSGESWDIEFYAKNPGTWGIYSNNIKHISNDYKNSLGGMYTTIKYV